MIPYLCEDCPCRLFNVKHYNLKGIGNRLSGNCVIIPNVDYSAYKQGDLSYSSQVEIIQSILSSTGEVDYYITPYIKCNAAISCELTEDIYARCLEYLKKEIKGYQFNNILLLGDPVRRTLHIDITGHLDNIYIDGKHHRKYIVNYSPLTKYTNEGRFKDFTYYLKKWYNAIRSNDFSLYNRVWL